MGFELCDLTIGYPARRGRREHRVLAGLSATAPPGDLTVLIGPNGTGKSTLLRTLAGLQSPLAGAVRLGDADVARLRPAERARRLAVVLTERDLPPLLTARELAGLGRHQHTGFTGRLAPADHAATNGALDAVGALPLADRLVSELSDGERQRVMIARALAQDPAAILLDEPTAFLDVTARVALMGLLRRLARERAVIVSTHDLELALRVADRLWLLTPDHHLRTGTPEQLAVDGAINAAFDGADLAFDPATGVFTLNGGTAGTARVTAGDPHRPLLERALSRYGWQIVTDLPADLHVTWNGDGYQADHRETRHQFATLADLTAWARHVTAEPGLTVRR